MSDVVQEETEIDEEWRGPIDESLAGRREPDIRPGVKIEDNGDAGWMGRHRGPSRGSDGRAAERLSNAGEEATLAEGRPPRSKGDPSERDHSSPPARRGDGGRSERRGRQGRSCKETQEPPRSRNHRVMPSTWRSMRCGPYGTRLGAAWTWSAGPLRYQAGRVC